MKVAKLISENLCAWMKSTPLLDTNEKVSKKAGIGLETVRRIKKGDTNPTIENIAAIANAFGKQAHELVTPPDNTAPYSIRESSPAAYCLPEEQLQAESIKLLAEMDSDDADVWLVTTKAAANKARRAKQTLGEQPSPTPDQAQ